MDDIDPKNEPVQPLAPESEELPQLSAKKLEEIKARAAKTVAAERQKALEDAAYKEELAKLRGGANERTGNPVEDEQVRITVRLGDSADRVTLDGKAYFHGASYVVPRHIARTLLDIAWRTEMHEHAITDKPWTEFHRKPRHTAVSRAGIVNAPHNPGATH